MKREEASEDIEGALLVLKGYNGFSKMQKIVHCCFCGLLTLAVLALLITYDGSAEGHLDTSIWSLLFGGCYSLFAWRMGALAGLKVSVFVGLILILSAQSMITLLQYFGKDTWAVAFGAFLELGKHIFGVNLGRFVIWNNSYGILVLWLYMGLFSTTVDWLNKKVIGLFGYSFVLPWVLGLFVYDVIFMVQPSLARPPRSFKPHDWTLHIGGATNIVMLHFISLLDPGEFNTLLDKYYGKGIVACLFISSLFIALFGSLVKAQTLASLARDKPGQNDLQAHSDTHDTKESAFNEEALRKGNMNGTI